MEEGALVQVQLARDAPAVLVDLGAARVLALRDIARLLKQRQIGV
jgi:hypothetical protein